MKRYLNMICRAALMGVAALALFSCTREPMPEIETVPADGRVVHFRAMQARTRASFGDKEGDAYPTLWTDNDAAVKLSLNYGSAVSAEVNPSQDYRSATFDATVDFGGVAGPYTFYSVSPASAAYALSPSREAWKVSIPCEQTPTAGSADEAGIILAAASQSYDQAPDVDAVDLYFNHLTAYGRFSLANLSLAEGETVSAVELTVTTPIAGDWYWQCADASLTDYGASSTITLHTSSTSNIWFACAPVDVSGQSLIVRVFTSEGVHEQLTEFPANRRFTAGQVAVFTVNMDGAEFTAEGAQGSGPGSGPFTLVTDASTLQAGDEVLIVYTDGGKAMGAIDQSGNFRTEEDITIAGSTIASEGSAVVLTLVAGSSAGTWAFQDGENYLTSPSATKNYLQNSTSITANSSWAVSIADGLATVEAQAGSRTFLLYNNSSPRFTCYDSADKSGMSKVSLYRRSGGASGASATDPMLAETGYGCYLGAAQEWEYNPGTDQLTRSYDGNGVLTCTLINPATVDELEIAGYKRSYVKGDRVTLTVNWRHGVSTVIGNAQYTMYIIKEDGPKVWLGDGSGKGFIIKK
ncbi:MAG: hypothetical protein K6D54_09010 [Bacteroidales bacterium]|nr:hypothetical protein [Bacteroidales bacterium]